jgi:putative DNA primase/helicase
MRILGALVGNENVAGPTLSSFKDRFGLEPLLGKSLAAISDARLNNSSAHVVVERLLSISGEDTLTVDRKNKDQWTGKLPSRIMVCSNELPRLGDASAAIAGRFSTLQLVHSFLGKEDHGLEARIRPELPGILNWSLDGLARLGKQGKFTRPRSTDEAMIRLQDLASPVAAFVRDCCTVGANDKVGVDALYKKWGEWTLDNGQTKSAKTVFGRDLHAVIPGLKVPRPGSGDVRDRVYVGVALKTDGPEPGPEPEPESDFEAEAARKHGG